MFSDGEENVAVFGRFKIRVHSSFKKKRELRLFQSSQKFTMVAALHAVSMEDTFATWFLCFPSVAEGKMELSTATERVRKFTI